MLTPYIGRILIEIAGSVAVCLLLVEGAGADVKLPPALESALRDEIFPAHQQGNALLVLTNASGIMPRLTDAQLNAIDEFLTAQQAPGLVAMIVDARLQLVDQNLAKQLPKPSPREWALIAPEIAERVERAMAECARLADDGPQPNARARNMDEFEDGIHRMQMAARQGDTAVRWAQYGQQLAGAFRAGTPRRLRNVTTEAPGLDFSAAIVRATTLRRQIEEREMVLRLARWRLAATTLDQSTDFRERFVAIGALDADATALASYFADSDAGRTFSAPDLKQPGLAAEIASLTGARSRAAGDLVEKYRLFHTGLHWWLRGRYGRGPDGYGMLKSELALASPEAQMGIYMPADLSASAGQVRAVEPHVERRHHFIWMFEYRQLIRSSETHRTASGVAKQGSLRGLRPGDGAEVDYIQMSISHWNVVSKAITREDARFVGRLVGFLEYSHALQHLDSLVSKSNQTELAVYDDLLKDRPEFEVETNLSRSFEQGGSTLSAVANDLGAPNAERGLRWITALGRAELGSMLSAFTKVERPFDVIANAAFDGAQYNTLLLDGARMHYWALRADPALSQATRGTGDMRQTLAYTRRLQLARALLSAAARSGQYQPLQQQEMRSWDESLKTVEGRLVATVQASLQTEVHKTREVRASATDGRANNWFPETKEFKNLRYTTPVQLFWDVYNLPGGK